MRFSPLDSGSIVFTLTNLGFLSFGGSASSGPAIAGVGGEEGARGTRVRNYAAEPLLAE
eukprot:CAMPEP_0179153346 /NCGR_PEP_ID=MMETSP0796-20121207/74565_1 /TAXON_ID=73915 /ORGANISM="Pyrodinium bahamense, Strain pbaha01" /LENGTH=58 /DNA_ID=CAMNT_0020854619 /DNA_START=9 /DNA_END=183 /DNA_ORIENTATION=-